MYIIFSNLYNILYNILRNRLLKLFCDSFRWLRGTKSLCQKWNCSTP